MVPLFNTPDLYYRLISRLDETRPELGVSDNGEIQNAGYGLTRLFTYP